MNQVSISVLWATIAVLLIIAAVIPVNSVDDSVKKSKQTAAHAKSATASAKGGASTGGNNAHETLTNATLSPSNTTIHSSQNCTDRDNVTGECKAKNSGTWYNNIISKNKGMLERTMYVLIGVTVIVVLYFVIKTIRLRRRKSKTRKYGVLSTSGQDNMEMTPLDQEDEDEDMTVFELNGHARK